MQVEVKDQRSGKQIFSQVIPEIPCEDSSPIYLGFLSDTHNSYSNQEKLRSVLSKSWEYGKIHFLLHGGDVVHKGGKIEEWEEFFQATSQAVSPSPLISAIGNHEYQSLNLVQGPPPFEKYLTGKSSPWYGHLLTFPQCKILIFNSNFNRLTTTARAEQWIFLERELQRADAEGIPLILLSHHAAFTSNIFKKRRPETQELQVTLVRLLEKYKVPLMLSGDVHLYERSEKNGISYITAGAFAWYRMPSLGGNPYQKFSKSLTATYTWLKVTKRQIVIKTFSSDRTLIDEHLIDMTKQ